MRSVFVVISSASLAAVLAVPAGAEPGKVRQAITVRERPGDSYRVVGKLAAGAKVQLGRRKDGWVKLEGARGGWVPESAVAAGRGAGVEPAKAARARPAPAPKAARARAVASRSGAKAPAGGKKSKAARGAGKAAASSDDAEAAYAAAEAEWSGEAAPAPAKSRSARTAPPPSPPPPAEEEAPPPPRKKAVAAEPPAEEEAPAEPSADEEAAPPPPHRRLVAQADDEPAGDEEPAVRKKKGKKKHGKSDDEEETGEEDLDGKRHPGLLAHLWGMAGYNSWHEKVTSVTDNTKVPLSNYDVPVGSVGVSIDGGAGYNFGSGFLVYLDGAYRYFGANPGIKINIEGKDSQALGVVSHGVDVGLRLGMLTDVVGAYGRVGWTSTLTLVGYSDDAPLPSEKLKAIAVGGGLELPRLGPRVHARVRGDYLIAPSRVQYANVDPFNTMYDGEKQATVAWSASATLGIRMVKQFGVILGLHYRFVDSQFEGASDRVKDPMDPMTKPVTDTKRTSTTLLATGGVGFLWR